MKAKISVKLTLLCLVCISLFSFDLPKEWFKAGSAPDAYEMGIDKGAGPNGTNAATIKSIKKRIRGFGCLMQNSQPDKFKGKRVRMSAYLKSKDVIDYASLWFRVDQRGTDIPLSFDNMRDGKIDRSIKGATDWAKYEIVLDVPEKASNLAYGAFVSGTGQIWFTNIKFEIVDKSVPSTNMSGEERTLEEPSNLDFEN